MDTDAPGEPDEDAAEASPEQAAAAPSSKPAAAHSRPAAKLVPADNVVAMKSLGGNYVVGRGRLAGLRKGMVLQVVAGPVKDGKARLLGEATVLMARPLRSELEPDATVRAAGKIERLLVLPAASRTALEQAEQEDEDSTSEPKAPAAAPAPVAEVKPAEAAPPQIRELNGRINVTGFAVLKTIEITNSDSFAWTECTLVTAGRQVYRLGRVTPNATQNAPLRDFRRGGQDVDFVRKDRVGLVCAEGRAEFPAKDL